MKNHNNSQHMLLFNPSSLPFCDLDLYILRIMKKMANGEPLGPPGRPGKGSYLERLQNEKDHGMGTERYKKCLKG